MATFDDLDAPQFSTFDDNDLLEVETYFEIDHEIGPTSRKDRIEAYDKSLEENFYSPLQYNTDGNAAVTLLPPSTGKFIELRSRKVRRSLSSGNLPISTNINTIVKLNCKEDKEKVEYGKLKKVPSHSKLKWSSQENLNRLAAPKNVHSSMGHLAQPKQYVSVAEAVKKFQELTPTRFRSRNKNQDSFQNGVPVRLKPTIPQSPKLLTKKRIKNIAPVMSYEEREKVEFEEAQKFKIKAHPINKKILKQPMKAIHVEKKPATIPEPFKLTQVNSKKPTPSPRQEEYHFHAKPVPKSVLGAPRLPDKQQLKVTLPVTPSFIKKIPKPSPVKKDSEKPSSIPVGHTRPEPFSFEKRDLNLQRKREELIKKVTDEEKKAREFHARPIPKPVATLINKQKEKSVNSSHTSSHEVDMGHNNCNSEEHFKARPAVVLYQKPFEPKRLEHPLTEIQPFQLYSELRAKERENFEKKKREQEERAAEIMKKEEEERIKKEQEEIKKLRKEINFKAHPVRNFKEIIIKPSGKVTEPISPVFLSGKKHNKENLQQSP